MRKYLTPVPLALRYSLGVGDATEDRVGELRRMLEAELDRRTGGPRGCWPLLVAVAGALLGLVLLSARC